MYVYSMYILVCILLLAIKNVKQKLEGTQNLIDELPTCNRLLLSWMIVHMTNIIAMVISYTFIIKQVK